MPGGIRFEHLPDIAILTHPERLKADAALGKSRLEKLCMTNKTRHPISTSGAFFFVATCFL